MKVLVAMSGGVDSSVAALLLREQGHDVVGVTMRLWGGESDTGCCSVSDVDDARRVAQQVGIDHLVFNFTDEFNTRVVDPYVDAHRLGVTPNPCIECNRHLKFDKLIERGRTLGFDAVATGHHARIARDGGGALRVTRGADVNKDQSYVVHMLSGDDIAYTLFPVGTMTKHEVRQVAERHGLRTADKPDSQDVCFIGSTIGREGFLSKRMDFTPADVFDMDGNKISRVESVQMVTVGQRRGLNLGGGDKRYVVAVDVDEPRVVVGDESHLFVDSVTIGQPEWPYASDVPLSPARVLVQGSAHGIAHPGHIVERDGVIQLTWDEPVRRIAPGQSVVFYDESNTHVVGGGIVV